MAVTIVSAVLLSLVQALTPGVARAACAAPIAIGTDTTNEPLRPMFRWSSSNPGATYTLYVQHANSDVIVIGQNGIPGTSFTPAADLPVGVPLRWKVKAEGACGTSLYSAIVYFTVNPNASCTPPAGAPAGSTPNTPNESSRPTFRWSGVGGTGIRYTLHVLRVSDSSEVDKVQGTAGTTYTPSNDYPVGVPLRWKVKAEGACGTGPYSAYVNFTVNPVATCVPPAGAPTR
jgi:hypothetical protein